MDRDEVFGVLRAFEASGLQYVLIGAAAIGVHGVVRATEGLDVLIQATPDNIESSGTLPLEEGHGPRERPRRRRGAPRALHTGRRSMIPTGRVQKFRSIEEMNAAQVIERDGDHFERFLRHCARYFALSPRTYPRGVFRFRSIEEAQRAR